MSDSDETLFMERLQEQGFSDADLALAGSALRQILDRYDAPGADTAKLYGEFVALLARFDLTPDDIAYGRNAVTYEEFRRAYEVLAAALAPYGKNSLESDTAYCIVDDNYGTRELLVEIIDPRIDWPDAKRAIAERLADRLPSWTVIVRASGAPDERIGNVDER